nr:hypothetical protein [uncultured Carboxylicivirga sp.]
MDIKQTSTHLQRLGQPFDVLINKGGVERQLYKNLEPTDVETLLKEVKDTHNPDSIIIQEKRRNGSSNVKEGEKYPIALNGIQDSPTNQNPMNTSQVQSFNASTDIKDYMLLDLKEKLADYKERNKKLEAENETLKKENFELEKDNKYKDKEFELERKGQEYEKSNGLSGVLETVSTNPALATIAATAIGRLMGIDVPAIGAIEPGTEQPVHEQASADTIPAKVAEQIKAWVGSQSDEIAQQIYAVFTQLATDVDKIPDVLTFLSEE